MIAVLLLAAAAAPVVVSGIPKVIYTTHGPTKGDNWDEYARILRETNPTFEVKSFDDEAAAKYVAEAYEGTKVAEVYEKAERPVTKADLFRLAIVAKEGGFYADMDFLGKADMSDLAATTAAFPLEWYKSEDAFRERHLAEPRDDAER